MIAPPQSSVKKINQYLIYLNQRLGGGNFGQVFLATDSVNHQNHACKIIPRDRLESNQVEKKCLENEIISMRNLLNLNCDHLVQLNSVESSPNNIYIIMEYCNQGTLKNLIYNNKSKTYNDLPAGRIIDLFKEICLGVDAIHSLNIMHRDLKPDNILMSNDRVKIGDFGFAKMLVTQTAQKHSFKCTPAYGSPQVMNGESYSQKTDVWSLGVILYEMIYHRMPFVSSFGDPIQMYKDFYQQHQKLTSKKQIPLPSIPEISSQIKELLYGMLQFREQDRLTIKEVLEMPIFQLKHSNPLQIAAAQLEQHPDEKMNPSLIQNIIGHTEELVDNEITVNRNVNHLSMREPENQAYVPLRSENELAENLTTKEQEEYQKLRGEALLRITQEKFIFELERMLFFHRNKAMLVQLIMSNFIVNQSLFSFIPSYQSILITLYMFYYYYYSLQTINQFFLDATISDESLYKAYQQHSQFNLTKEKLGNDLSNAKKLHKSIDQSLKSQLIERVKQLQYAQVPDDEPQRLCSEFYTLQANNCSDINVYMDRLKQLLERLYPVANLEQLQQQNVLKIWYTVLIVGKIDKYINNEQYSQFDQQKFIEELIMRLDPSQIKAKIKEWGAL